MNEVIPPPMKYAGFWRRFNAYGIDSLIVLVLAGLIAWFVPGAHAQTAAEMQTLVDSGIISPETDPQVLASQLLGTDNLFSWNDVILPMIVSAIYNILFVAGSWQATPGKHWCKVKVVMAGGRKLTLLESAIRHTVSGLSMWPLGLGYLPMFFTKQKLALHDMICQTRVIMR